MNLASDSCLPLGKWGLLTVAENQDPADFRLAFENSNGGAASKVGKEGLHRTGVPTYSWGLC